MTKNLKNQSGQALSEYMILTLLIAVASIAIVTSIGTQVLDKLTTIRDNIQNKVTLKAVQGG